MKTSSRATGAAAGFAGLDEEIEVQSLPVDGRFPSWLSGTLLRNGPALFDPPGKSFRHWFDGLAMLHAFEFDNGSVSYRNRFLDTAAFRSVRRDGRIGYAEFATDPCVSLFRRFFTRFLPRRQSPTSNPNVNIVRLGETFLALTETPIPVEFDPVTLETLGVRPYDDALRGQITTAHPHADPRTGDLINYALHFGRTSEYRIYRQAAGSGSRELIATVPTDNPGYVHSFAVTENHIVLVVFPLVVDPLSFLLRDRPFIENYRWRPELGTRIVVVDSRTGGIRTDTRTDAFFAFHHINAWDEDSEVVFDLCAYPDAGVVEAFYLDRLRAGRPVPVSHPTRYRVGLDDGHVHAARLGDETMELPRISYGQYNGRLYRFAYGTGFRDNGGHDFFDQLVKLDVETGQGFRWHHAGTYPGEPVFVPAPDGRAEDDGVVLSVVLDAATSRSFLLVLDARSFTELARAEVPIALPFGFHGLFGGLVTRGTGS